MSEITIRDRAERKAGSALWRAAALIYLAVLPSAWPSAPDPARAEGRPSDRQYAQLDLIEVCTGADVTNVLHRVIKETYDYKTILLDVDIQFDIADFTVLQNVPTTNGGRFARCSADLFVRAIFGDLKWYGGDQEQARASFLNRFGRVMFTVSYRHDGAFIFNLILIGNYRIYIL